MSFTDALSRISQIEQEVSSLTSGALAGGGTVTDSSATAASSSGSTSSTSSTDFANALNQAQSGDATAAADPTAAPTAAGAVTDPAAVSALTDPTASSALTDPTASSALTDPTATGAVTDPTAISALTDPSAATGTVDPSDLLANGDVTDPSTTAFPTLAGSELAPTTDSALPLSGGSGLAPYATTDGITPYATTSGVALPPSAGTMLTSDQQQFASTLSAETGLNPGVVSSWLLAEESGGAAQSRQAAGNNDWLNIGYTGSGTFGASDTIWSNPVSAANATAQWLQGQDSIPGYGTASSGIQSILSTVGQAPEAQIAALQGSGWSGSGYPSLPAIYATVAGS